MSDDNVIFCTRTNRIIDLVLSFGTAASALSALARAYGPDLVELDFAEATRRYEAHFLRGPVPISAERFHEMLCVLPPVGWTSVGDTETFKLLERTAGNVTAIFARIGERHFELSDSIFMTHADIVVAVRALAAFSEPGLPAKA